MKILGVIVLLFLAMGCDGNAPKVKIAEGPYAATSQRVLNSVVRIENNEVICYTKTAYESGIFCKFKE